LKFPHRAHDLNDAVASAAQRSLAGHLQQIWEVGSPAFDQGFANLASITSQKAYTDALDALSGQEVAAVASSRYEASQNLARDAFDCSAQTTIRNGSGCVWARGTGAVIDHDASGGFPDSG
jgi:hypothetical protein